MSRVFSKLFQFIKEVRKILVKNQKITVFWAGRTKKHYISKGYKFTKKDDTFEVDVKDLPIRSNQKVDLICDQCGIKYKSPYFAYCERKSKNNADLCHSCAAKYGHSLNKEIRSKKHFDKIKDICNKYGYELITKESDYTGIKMDIQFKCEKHGIQTMNMSNFIAGHKCYFCSYEERGFNCRHSNDYIEQQINSVNGNKLLNKEDYKGANVRNLRVLCGKCNNHIFITSFSDYFNCKINQCRSCSSKESVGEKRIADYLNDNQIEFVREKKFDDCRDKRALPFDFYVPQYNLLIEFDGQHHYWDVWGKDHFEKTQKHDKIKNQYCDTNNINLLRIPYWQGNDIKKIIQDKIDSI